MTWRDYIAVAAFLLLSGCTMPWGGISSENQSGGVTASSVGTVNQTIAPFVKSPYLKTLQDFYYDGGQLAHQWQWMPQGTTDKQVGELSLKSANWVNDTYNWISKNITPAAAERFARIQPQLGEWHITDGTHSQTTQETFSTWYKTMPQYLDNLDALMRSNEMYPQ